MIKNKLLIIFLASAIAFLSGCAYLGYSAFDDDEYIWENWNNSTNAVPTEVIYD